MVASAATPPLLPELLPELELVLVVAVVRAHTDRPHRPGGASSGTAGEEAQTRA